MILLEWLRRVVDLIPPGGAVTVPRDWLLSLLESANGVATGADTARAEGMLTLVEVARRYTRSTSTVRGWCEAGLLPGAFRLRGRAWRIPASALGLFEAQLSPTFRTSPEAAPRSLGPDQSIAEWRNRV